MKKLVLLVALAWAGFGLVGCGGGGGGSTVLMGTVTGAAGTTSSLALRVRQSEESFDETVSVNDDGEFRARSVPEGTAAVSISRTGESTSIGFDVDLEKGKTTEVDVFLMTWSPEPVGELRSKLGSSGSFSSHRPLGPSGSTLESASDGSRIVRTPKGLKVTRRADGSVTVDDTNYVP